MSGRAQVSDASGVVGSRREFLQATVGALFAPALLACAGSPALPDPDDFGDPRLRTRPAPPTEGFVRGASPLGLSDSRDGLLYVPGTYSPASPAPLLVLLHGAKGSADSWASFHARAEATATVLLLPESRSPVSWDLVLTGFREDLDFIDRALELAFSRCNIDPARVWLGGFSDGATYALSLGIRNGDLFSRLLGFSPGFLVRRDPIGRPRVFISHGTPDATFSVKYTRDDIVGTLRRVGYDVTYLEFVGGHGVPASVGDASMEWLGASDGT